MERRHFITRLLSLPAGAAFALPVSESRAAAVTETDAAAGVRVALERGALAAVRLLGRPDGFLANPKVRIPLPAPLERAAQLLRLAGQSRQVDDLVTAMNRAAESAVPQAQTLLVGAVRSMSVEDALRLVSGGDTSVTEFFAAKTRQPLGTRFEPIVSRATQKVALAQKYDAVAGKAAAFGVVRAEDANVQQYVTRKALDGLYLMIGEEEKKIRHDPWGTGSAVLRRVFGG